MTSIKQLASETAIYGLSSILGRVLNFLILTAYLTREFSQSQSLYGIHGDLYAYTAFLLILSTHRMETAYFRYGSDPGQEQKAFTSALSSVTLTTLVLVAILLVGQDLFSDWLQYPGDNSRFVVYFALIIGFDAVVAVPFARLRLQNRPLRFALIKVFQVLFNIGLVLFLLEGCPWLIEQGYDGFSAIYSHETRLDLVFISNLCASALVSLLLIPDFFRTSFVFSGQLLRTMILYALPLIVVGLAGVFNQSFAVPLLKYLLPDSITENLNQAGIYAAAARLAILMNLFTQAFNYAAEPFFFKKAREGNAKVTYAEVAQAFALVASIGFLGITLYLDIIQLLLGANYREGVYVVPILLLAYWCLGLYYNFSIWYKIKDKTHIGALISLGGAAITLTVAILLVRSVGMVAMAWAALGCYAFMALAGFVTGRYYYPVDYPIGKMMRYIVLALLIYAVSYFLSDLLSSRALRLFVNTLLLLSYLLAVYALDRQDILRWLDPEGTRASEV